MQRNIWLMAITSIVLLVVINNTVFFTIIKKTLEDELKDDLLNLAHQIEISVEKSKLGAYKFEEQMDRELLTASIASKYALLSQNGIISNEELKNLANELNVSDLNIMKRTEEGNLILFRTTSMYETSESNITPLDMLSKQFNEKLLEMDFVENFWIDIKKTNSERYKAGYYFDVNSNYIINPYLPMDKLNEFNQLTGVEQYISDILELNPSLLEISLVNPDTFTQGNTTIGMLDQDHHSEVRRPILSGNYSYVSSHDPQDVKEAFYSNTHSIRVEKLDSAHTYKMFIPVKKSDSTMNFYQGPDRIPNHYVIMIVADYNFLTDQLLIKFRNIGFITLAITSIMIPLVILVMRYFSRMKEQAVKVAQDTYIEEINALFQSIRSQRHDFINQVQTIHSLTKVKMYDELQRYTESLAGEIHYVNDFINIGNPAVAALIRSKLSQADSYRILFQIDMLGVNLHTMAGKVLDVNRIIGNLIDNAFDEVIKYEENNRQVSLYGREENNKLLIKVSNYCANANKIINQPIFQNGFSSKGGEHQGLGLAIISSLVAQYKGTLEVHAIDENRIEFTVAISL